MTLLPDAYNLMRFIQAVSPSTLNWFKPKNRKNVLSLDLRSDDIIFALLALLIASLQYNLVWLLIYYIEQIMKIFNCSTICLCFYNIITVWNIQAFLSNKFLDKNLLLLFTEELNASQVKRRIFPSLYLLLFRFCSHCWDLWKISATV